MTDAKTIDGIWVTPAQVKYPTEGLFTVLQFAPRSVPMIAQTRQPDLKEVQRVSKMNRRDQPFGMTETKLIIPTPRRGEPY